MCDEHEIPMREGTVLRKRKKPKIIRYVRYNREQELENFFREQLMLFYPWRNESQDLIGNFQTFEEQYNSKIAIISVSKRKYEMDHGVTDIVVNNFGNTKQ